MIKDFEFLPHTADIQIRVYGKTLPELFRNALIGMFQSIKPQAPACRMVNNRLLCDELPQRREVAVQSVDMNALLVDFLSEALYFSDVYDEAYLDADIHELTQTVVKATLHGIVVTRFDVVEIKAVTYHDLEITETDEGWSVDVLFDI